MCEVINLIDETGFKGAIFMFGFALMKRSISFRGSKRVPTHIILHMGLGHNIENVVQAAGRGTFIGKHILLENGHSHVTALMPSGDWDMCVAHQKYVHEVHERVVKGEPIRAAMQGAIKALPQYADYTRHTNRRTGMRKKGKPKAFDSMHNPIFDSPVLTEGEEANVKWYAAEENTECYRVAETCSRLWSNSAVEFEAETITEAFNDTYRSDHAKISNTKVKRHIKTNLLKDNLISQKPGEKKHTQRYSLERTERRLNALLLKVRDVHLERESNRVNETVTDSLTASCEGADREGNKESPFAKRIKTEEGIEQKMEADSYVDYARTH